MGDGKPRISLLHATYKRVGGPLDVRDAWLDRAAEPDSIEYVVSMDADDVATVALTEGIPRLVNPTWEGMVTSVRNWNAAAAASRGDILVVIADDLFPPRWWDRTLIEMTGALDPRRTPFAVKVSDAHRPGDERVLLRHPVVSRAFYSKFGLFSPSYRGVYCDDDFTARAFWRSAIIDGRALHFQHGGPSDEAANSESSQRVNRREEYVYGAAQYSAAWSLRKRKAKRLLVPPASAGNLSHWSLFVTQRRYRALSNLEYLLRGSRKAFTLLSHRAHVSLSPTLRVHR